MAMQRCVFLDRDGVINRDTGYVGRWENFEYLPRVVEALRALAAAGWRLVVVTNQSGIARGFYTEEDFLELSRRMTADLASRGVAIEAVYHCPHLPGATVARYARDCDCRKPMPGLILRAGRELGIDLAASVFVGDKKSDMQAAAAAGVGRRIFVAAGRDAAELGGLAVDGVFADLAEAVSATQAFGAARG
jgi:D-glycero-D-manno-heptose 1,7-bisphosphate phosphatase